MNRAPATANNRLAVGDLEFRFDSIVGQQAASPGRTLRRDSYALFKSHAESIRASGDPPTQQCLREL